ncbi:hypothetical protein COOONC_23681 [Cooperia oncophora]
MTASDTSSCPDCHSRTVRWRNTLSGLLYAIFCFPCGIYCCLKRRQQHCSQCDCDVIKCSRGAAVTFPRLLLPWIRHDGERNTGVIGRRLQKYRLYGQFPFFDWNS